MLLKRDYLLVQFDFKRHHYGFFGMIASYLCRHHKTPKKHSGRLILSSTLITLIAMNIFNCLGVSFQIKRLVSTILALINLFINYFYNVDEEEIELFQFIFYSICNYLSVASLIVMESPKTEYFLL